MHGIPIIEDITFWHLIAGVSSGIMIKMMSKHLQKTEDTLTSVTELLNKLITKDEVQDVKLANHDKRIEHLEQK